MGVHVARIEVEEKEEAMQLRKALKPVAKAHGYNTVGPFLAEVVRALVRGQRLTKGGKIVTPRHKKENL